MKNALVVFALKEKLKEPGDTRELAYGQCIEHGDSVGYLYEDRLDPGNDPPLPDLAGRTVFLLQHMSGSANHRAQRSWVEKANPTIVFRRPDFMHEGASKLLLRRLFVERAAEQLGIVLDELFVQESLDLLEQTLAWNALMQFLPEQKVQRAARDKRDAFAQQLTLACVTDDNLASLGLNPQAWDSRLRARVADVAKLMNPS